jgi:ADP-ribose pyrophosphatase
MTVGMADESCGFVFGYCDGQPTNAHQEGSEDIQVVLADRAECRRILKEELVAMPCALVLMQFINGESDLLASFAG